MAYTSGQIAKMAGVNVETIRFYERKGLLTAAGRRPSGFRQFSKEAVARIRFIKRAQELGFSLREIQELLALRIDSDAVCADVRKRTEAKVHVIEEKVEDLKRIHSVLLGLLKTCDKSGTTEECPILDALEKGLESLREVPENSELETYRQGYEFMLEEIRSVLDKFEVTEIPGLGKLFDPNIHEAVLREVTSDHEDGKILDELRKGYKIQHQLLRPTQVRVAVQPDQETVTEGKGDE